MVKKRKKKIIDAGENAFVLWDGRRLSTIYHLIDELETMHDDRFYSYVNEHKNDFANWVQDVFKADSLAEEMRKVPSRLETQRIMLKHLVRELTNGAR